jgi:fumarylacetoacetase
MVTDATHDPALVSWVDSANDPAGDFPIQNLPFGRFREAGGAWRIGVAIGDEVLGLKAAGLVEQDDIAPLLAAPASARRALRAALSEGLRRGSSRESSWRRALRPRSKIELGLPCEIRAFTDFYTGIHHATAVGRLFRPDNPLLPNYKWVPIAYHARSSSILPSGGSFRRPRGQVKPAEAAAPVLMPTERLDYELELGILVGRGNALGEPVPIDEAESRIFGLTLLNDWSARDVQAWEYQPLGPFLGKNFATTVSPWVVTQEALAPFRVPAFTRPKGDPEPLPHLSDAEDRAHGGFDITLEAYLATEAMRSAGMPPKRLTQTSFATTYWTFAQMVAHHTSNGCDLATGDLIGSGTVSGPEKSSWGSLLELTARGREPIELQSGEQRGFIEDGDEIIFRGFAEKSGYPRVGFGECRAVLLPAN